MSAFKRARAAAGQPAADEAFAERELLSEDEMLAMLGEGPQLAARAANGVSVSVTEMRYYMPYSPYGGPGRAIAHIEPDVQLRAFGVCEAKVGSVLEEPLEVLWARALAWRNDPFMVERIGDITNAHDWAPRRARAEPEIRLPRRPAPHRTAQRELTRSQARALLHSVTVLSRRCNSSRRPTCAAIRALRVTIPSTTSSAPRRTTGIRLTPECTKTRSRRFRPPYGW
jgi:hypothetical protein